MNRYVLTASVWVVIGSQISFCLGTEVSSTAIHRPSESTYVVLRGEVSLPAEGVWQGRSASDESVVQLYLMPSQPFEQHLGRRAGGAVRQKRIDRGRWQVQMLHSACLDYAKNHGGMGPESIDDVDQERYEWLRRQLQTSPWRNVELAPGQPLTGPFVFLVPKAVFHFASQENRRVPPDQREVLAVELRPYVDDGKHWVLFTDGSCLRNSIDAQLVRQHKLTIRPVVQEAGQIANNERPTVAYTLVAVRKATATQPFEVTVNNTVSDEQRNLQWDPAGAEENPAVADTLRKVRRFTWQPYLETGPAPILRTWLSAGDSRPDGRAGDNLTMFSLLGGRAAVEETLQLQDLTVVRTDESAMVDVGSLQGVKVKAHPFEEMLAGQPGGRLELANVAPPDRLFVYVAQPEAILPFLDEGAGFLAVVGTGLTGNRLDYDLTRRYLERLGVTRPWLETVLQSGMIEDLAVMLPDLFLIDGTDVTVAARLAQPKVLGTLLQVLGVGELSAGEVLTVTSPAGQPAYWALRQDILCMSTNRGEIDRVLDLIECDGEGSLGQSAEFQYMLTQLPVQPQTRFHAYVSDPFVRRLVGPQVKLAQRRRIQARAQMETITAQTLLARLDGIPEVNSVDQLVRMDYLPDEVPIDDFSIEEDGSVQSEDFGSMQRMRTLEEVPVEKVTEAEAEAYRQYMENYSRYWRQFFDPIAIRLDDTPDGSLELTTFILPLVDSSIYNGLRELLVRHEDDLPLAVPQIAPSPVLQFSLNMRERAWQQVAGSFSELFTRYGGVSPALLDDLGPAAHLAVFDADPVIALGSGDMMGAFGGNVLRSGQNEMAMIPVALSLLTRPCTIRVETRDAERTARFLRQAATGWGRRRENTPWLRISFYQENDRDAWVWTMGIEGVMKLRFGVEVTDRYLVIRNIPWSTRDEVVGIRDLPLNGAALSVWPAASQLELPGLFASAADQERRATMSSLGRLYPLVASGAADVGSAGKLHQQLFGFRPLHPRGGAWQWEQGQLLSSDYGSPWRQRQPAFDPQRPFGMLNAIDDVHLTMQFEDSGLRSKIRWRLRQGE